MERYTSLHEVIDSHISNNLLIVHCTVKPSIVCIIGLFKYTDLKLCILLIVGITLKKCTVLRSLSVLLSIETSNPCESDMLVSSVDRGLVL